MSALWTHDIVTDGGDWEQEATSTPLVPIAMMAVTAITAVALVAVAIGDGAGETDEVSAEAVLAWFFGSLLGPLVLAWFGLLDSQRRSTGTYREPPFRPRLVAGVLVVLGWTAGLVGAVLVAQAVARR